MRLSSMHQQTDRDRTDIRLRQEAAGMAIEHNIFLQRGWIIHTHKNVAILISVHTVQNTMTPTKIWKGELPDGQPIDAMAIHLETPEGELIVMNAYLPAGVDDMTQGDGNPDKEELEQEQVATTTNKKKVKGK